MKRVIFTPEVRQFFVELVQILYDKGYFSFLDTAKKHVQDLYDDIE